jgi:hypothetical protein
LLPIDLYYDDLAQAALSLVSAVLAVAATRSYKGRSEGRYALLTLAFVFLCVVSVSTTLMEFLVNVGPAGIRLVEEYLNPSLELLMVSCLLVAVTRATKANDSSAPAVSLRRDAAGNAEAS